MNHLLNNIETPEIFELLCEEAKRILHDNWYACIVHPPFGPFENEVAYLKLKKERFDKNILDMPAFCTLRRKYDKMSK